MGDKTIDLKKKLSTMEGQLEAVVKEYQEFQREASVKDSQLRTRIVEVRSQIKLLKELVSK